VFRNYRRWAVESAALDLALCQAETDLASRLGREYDPVRFLVSSRLGDPSTGDRVFDLLDREPDLEFKLDPTPAWTPALVERLADTDAVRILDLKRLYDGTEVDVSATPELYELVLDGFPGAIVEDPDLTDETRSLFEGHEGRVSWDYPIEGVDSVRALPRESDWLKLKLPVRLRQVTARHGRVRPRARHPAVQRRPVRARGRSCPPPRARLAVLPRRPERYRTTRVQRPRPARRTARESARPAR